MLLLDPDEDTIFPVKDEVSNPWSWPKDGRMRITDPKYMRK